ncbi:MAG: shikimate kinase [Clostridiales bacterium]|jgi:shikimate dehydrogenase|nr:shikimate kinase [Clostridiales bacterium]
MTFGLLGEHLSHSYSPLIHSMLGKYTYKLFPTPREELAVFLTEGDFNGLNVTIPYKKAVIPYLTELSPRARKLGSVNTILRRADGSLYGDNTDYGGFRYMLRGRESLIRGKKVLVLGSGGASVTVVQVLRDIGAGEVVVISRSGADNYDDLDRHADAAFLVNTTPVGMYPDNGAAAVDLTCLPGLHGVADIIYNPEKTALMLQAQSLGIPAVGGLSMLVAQAKFSADIFLGKKQKDAVIEKVRQKISGQMKNIVLIGMPGCGKSIIGKRLAAILGREWIDIDTEIVKAAGKTIPEIFQQDGEDAFRTLETQCVAQAGKKSGCVISTGGGVVTRPENKDLLRQNGTIVYIWREMTETYREQLGLGKKGAQNRPLLAQHSPKELEQQRRPLYLAWSDVKILNIGIQETAWQLISFLHLSPAGKKKSHKKHR